MNEQAILNPADRIGIMNRGEAAVRCIRAVKEFNALYGTSLRTVSFFTDKEQDALFVKEADVAVPLSSLPGFAENQGNVYLNRKLMLEALASSDCRAVWVGWGFLSEDAPFVEMLEAAGLVFLGPSSRAMALLGDKIAAKELCEQSDVPILAWSRGPVRSHEEAENVIEKIGYPCIIKASNAGGGRGIRFVRTAAELEPQYRSAREETIRITGNDIVFIEQLVEKGRHLEVQVLADRHGNVRTFGVRDCSVQRRNQKIIEETPPPGFSPEMISEMQEAAARLIRAAGYESAGTVEYLYDLGKKQFYFMEVNTRLQVEHPITEQLYGIDLVKGQILVAMGKKVDGFSSTPRGVAIELRLNAEDPDRNFTPAPGKVVRFRLPSGPGIRVDSGIEQGSEIPSEYDSMVAKLIAYAPSRDEAFARLRRALQEMRIKIEGGTTNRAFLLQLLSTPDIRKGAVHTRFVEESVLSRPDILSRTDWHIALMASAVTQYLNREEEELNYFQQQLVLSGFPRDITPSNGLEVSLSAGGNVYAFTVKSVGKGEFHLCLDGHTYPVRMLSEDGESTLVYNGKSYHIQTVERGDILQCEVNGIPYGIERESGGYVKSPSPALVLSVQATPGDAVRKGDVLLTLEAMKMEMLVTAPEDGTVKEVLVSQRDQVTAGQSLVQLEAGEEKSSSDSPAAERVTFEEPATDAGSEFSLLRSELFAVFLGYDHQSSVQNILDHLLSFTRTYPDYRNSIGDALIRAFEMYSAVESLFSGREMEVEGFARPASCQELLVHFIKRGADKEKGLPGPFVENLELALTGYPGNAEDGRRYYLEALYRMYKSHADLEAKQTLLHSALFSVEDFPIAESDHRRVSDILDTITYLTQSEKPSLADAAIHARYTLIDRILVQNLKEQKKAKVSRIIALLGRTDPEGPIYAELLKNIVDAGHQVVAELISFAVSEDEQRSRLAMEILCRRFTRDREYVEGTMEESGPIRLFQVSSRKGGRDVRTVLAAAQAARFEPALAQLKFSLENSHEQDRTEAILLLLDDSGKQNQEVITKAAGKLPMNARWLSVGIAGKNRGDEYFRFIRSEDGSWAEDTPHRMISPIHYRELRIHRLRNFEQKLVYAGESAYLIAAKAKGNPRDERLFGFVEVTSARPEIGEDGSIQRMVALENAFMEAVYAMRAEQAKRKRRLYWNRFVIHIRTVLNTTAEQIRDYAGRLAARTVDLGIEKLVIYSRRQASSESRTEEVELLFENISGTSFTLRGRTPSETPLAPMDDYVAKVVRARQRGTIYPYEIVKMITRSGYPVSETFPRGDFEEYDITVDQETGTRSVHSVRGRPYGENTGNVVFGIIMNYLPSHPQGVRRVIILSDTTSDLGSLAEEECRRVNAALDLAEDLGLPVEWIPVSAGARIDMKSGTENLDWTACTLRRIISFTQNGGELNVIVSGINVGAQSYWNAEATMLMHTRGLLIMTEDASMLLTGKKALDFSGSVSAENNTGIGGVDRIMGPNGQAQVKVKNLYEAYTVLFRHYTLTWAEPGNMFPARQNSTDPVERNVEDSPYQDFLGQGFTRIGDIFSPEKNAEKKKPFDMRQVMKALVDSDGEYLERWLPMRDAETAIVWETRIGGYPVGMIGIESRTISRIGEVPHDGPEVWNGGTLFPLSSKKVARGINAFSGKLPLVILANLSGFDGSPESLRKLQLEYGAEIGRAIVNFKGPIIFVVTARYHGGAYVVFSKMLNPHFHSAALEGTYASVIGGAPAAAVVFPGQINKETAADPWVEEARNRLKEDDGFTQKDFDGVFQQVHKEKESELAQKFDRTHSVQRAKSVGSIDEIISPSRLRPYVIERIEKGVENYLSEKFRKQNSRGI